MARERGAAGNDRPGGRAGPTAWRLRPRRRRLPGGYLTAILGGVITLIAVPYAEELLRCARARRARRALSISDHNERTAVTSEPPAAPARPM